MTASDQPTMRTLESHFQGMSDPNLAPVTVPKKPMANVSSTVAVQARPRVRGSWGSGTDQQTFAPERILEKEEHRQMIDDRSPYCFPFVSLMDRDDRWKDEWLEAYSFDQEGSCV
jgi:hypothetical protein